MRFSDLIARLRPPRRPRTAKPQQPPATAQESDLAVRRDWLADQFAELQWDIGGMVYEMAIRDHFRLDVVIRHAARLQEIDAELAEVERMLRLDEAGAAGTCPSCGALYSRGAVYCWQCGNDLMARKTVSAPAPQAQPQSPVPQAPPPHHGTRR